VESSLNVEEDSNTRPEFNLGIDASDTAPHDQQNPGVLTTADVHIIKVVDDEDNSIEPSGPSSEINLYPTAPSDKPTLPISTPVDIHVNDAVEAETVVPLEHVQEDIIVTAEPNADAARHLTPSDGSVPTMPPDTETLHTTTDQGMIVDLSECTILHICHRNGYYIGTTRS
jgi:hypothetical protein